MLEIPNFDGLFPVSSDGIFGYSEVMSFLKEQPTIMAVYQSITTSCNNTIDLSENHLIYGRTSSTDKFSPM